MSLVFLVFLPAWSSLAIAGPAQPVPISEEPGINAQVEISGVGIGTAGKTGVDFSDSALLAGAAQRLYEAGAIGSLRFGVLAPDASVSGTGAPILIHQAFVDFQTERFEALIGRSDNPASHLVDFPTIREENLIEFTNPLDPFSSGANPEDSRYSNVASFTLNQGLAFYENIHVQHLADVARPQALNSFGVTFAWLVRPGMEALSRVVSVVAGFEHQDTGTSRDINQLLGGGIINLNKSLTDRVDFRLLEIANLDSVKPQAYLSSSAAIRYLHSPFGGPGAQLALTGAYKIFPEVSGAETYGLAVTGVRRLGSSFDLVAQYLLEHQSSGSEHRVEAGLVFAFNATINPHLSPRRTPLNYQHSYIPD